MSYGIDNFGRDDNIKCDCGGKTYLTYEAGYGLNSYECENAATRLECRRLQEVKLNPDEAWALFERVKTNTSGADEGSS